MNILGLSDVTGNHSHSCIALLQNGKLSMALSEERLSRIKNDCAFPREAINTVLQTAGLQLNDIDLFACGYPPPRYYASLLEHSLADLPRSLLSVACRRPDRLLKYVWPNIKKAIYDPSHAADNTILPLKKLVFIDHHLAHVTAAYAASGMEECLAISYGGFAPHADGRNVAGAVYRCRGDGIEFLEDIPFYATGCWYSGLTLALGFRYMQQEGKTMGLAGLGNPRVCFDEMKSLAVCFRDNQWLSNKYWIDFIFTPRAKVFLSSHSGRRLLAMVQRHGLENVAAAGQRLWSENMQNFIHYLMTKYCSKKFALAGGLFLNAAINQMIVEQSGVEEAFVFPHTGDGSTPIGAALQAHQSATGRLPRTGITDTAWGCSFDRSGVLQDMQNLADSLQYSEIIDIPDYAARQIMQGKIIGWFQGAEEYGPRSLGQRCILADSGVLAHKIEINRRKGREEWVPIGVSCLAEQGENYFKTWQPCPFATRTLTVLSEKRAQIAAAVHADGTARVQSIGSGQNSLFRKMLECCYKLGGSGLVLNSSLNSHGEPIVHLPAEAFALLVKGVVDELLIGNYAVTTKQAACSMALKSE